MCHIEPNDIYDILGKNKAEKRIAVSLQSSC